MRPRCPLPIGAVRSIIRAVRSSVEPLPASKQSGISGWRGVRFSKRILFLDSFGSATVSYTHLTLPTNREV